MSKKANSSGAMVYLVEELGDARLRCDQLVGYITEAVKLVNGSPAKEAVYEVAGHLVDTLPTTAFKLQKALQAVALSAARMDYEGLKQELQPEKVEELERVLQDVRIRQVTRRSMPLTQVEVSDYMGHLASALRDKQVPFDSMMGLIASLESGAKTASEASYEKTAQQLEGIADALREQSVSRLQLASTLRTMLAGLFQQGANVRLAKDDNRKVRSILEDIEADAKSVMSEASDVVKEALKAIISNAQKGQKL